MQDILIVCMLLYLSACKHHNNTDEVVELLIETGVASF